MKEFIDDSLLESGTPINRANMMAIQGFNGSKITFGNDGTIVQTNDNGETIITSVNSDGSIVSTIKGKKVLTKTTTFNSDGSITEVIS